MTGTYVEHGWLHLPDVHGFPRQMPVAAFDEVHRAANQCDAGRAYYRSRFEQVGAWFDRDVLNGAHGLVYPHDCGNCHDTPGTEPMEGGDLWCPSCCSAAQGSHLDDRQEV